jgi:hypothetical protein
MEEEEKDMLLGLRPCDDTSKDQQIITRCMTGKRKNKVYRTSCRTRYDFNGCIHCVEMVYGQYRT